MKILVVKQFILFVLIFLYSNLTAIAQNFITYTIPIQNQSHIPRNSQIIVGFNETISDSTLNNNSIVTYGTLSGRHFGNIVYDSVENKMFYTPLKIFASGERVFVSLTTEIMNTSGDTLFPAYSFGFSVKSDTGFNTVTCVKYQNIVGLNTIEDMNVADLDDDGDFDLIFCSNGNQPGTWKIITFINDGQANFQQYFENELSANPTHLAVGDFNNDGRQDIAAVAGDFIKFFRISGNGQLHDYASIGINNSGLIVSSDFNNDGTIDVLGLELNESSYPYTREVSFIKNLGNGIFEKINSYSFNASDSRYYVDVGDINNDGFNDLIISTSFSTNRALFLLNNGDGIFSLGTIKYLNETPFSLSVGDFDGDSDLDLALATDASSPFDGLQIFQNMGNTVFVYFSSFYIHSNPWNSFCTDFNNDGRLDIAATYGVGQRVGVYYGTGNLYFDNRNEVSLNPSSNPYLMDFADFDNDGDVDITVLNNGDNGRKLYFLQNGPSINDVEPNDLVSFNCSLSQNYPNPFNSITKIKYIIPTVASNRDASLLITLKVYDVLGNEIVILDNEVKPAGEYEIEFDGSNLTSGIYFYQLKANSYIETKKMILLK